MIILPPLTYLINIYFLCVYVLLRMDSSNFKRIGWLNGNWFSQIVEQNQVDEKNR